MVSDKKWLSVLMLCFLFGGLGAHRFYVGKIGSGFLFLITGGFLGIGMIVDLVKIIIGKFKDKDGAIIEPAL